ncbi:MAG: autotransporter outer membrane beta-barrel domain-containing protein [Vibrio hibernica]
MTIHFSSALHPFKHSIKMLGLSTLALFSFDSMAETSTRSSSSNSTSKTSQSIMLQKDDPIDSGVGAPAQTFKQTPKRQAKNTLEEASPGAQHNKEAWDRVLPFGSQQAIVNGYDLPLPFGISFIYTRVQQEQLISNVKVGYNQKEGSHRKDRPLTSIPSDIFRFDQFSTDTQTPQIKVDAWVLPFLNVFASVGQLSGTTDLDLVLRDTNHYNIEVDVKGHSYTVGAMIAGASGDWFYSMPLSYTESKMNKANVEGYALNIQPRVGYNFELNHGYKLSVYTGASYMDINQTLSGGYVPGDTTSPDQDRDGAILFQVDQENAEKWAGIVGFNVNINKHFSTAFEASGISGDRRQFLMMLNGRF